MGHVQMHLLCGLSFARIWRAPVVSAILVALSPAVSAQNAPYLVKDINPSGSGLPRFLAKVGDRVFFNGQDGVHGQELWVSDGTEELGGTANSLVVEGLDLGTYHWKVKCLNAFGWGDYSEEFYFTLY